MIPLLFGYWIFKYFTQRNTVLVKTKDGSLRGSTMETASGII